MQQRQPTADPFNDLDVIDRNAPRTVQATAGTFALLGVLLGEPLFWALFAAQLAIGLTLGRRFCLPCLAYFKLIQPRIGEGSLEDSRAPRFANMIGFAMLSSASTAWWLGAETLATVLGSITAALALFAAISGICAGCELYRLIARFRGISARHHDHIDPADLGLDLAAPVNGSGISAFVQFTHPLCSDCREWSERLAGKPEPTASIDVSRSEDLARKYGIAVVPAVFAIGPDGAVLERLAP